MLLRLVLDPWLPYRQNLRYSGGTLTQCHGARRNFVMKQRKALPAHMNCRMKLPSSYSLVPCFRRNSGGARSIID